MESHRGKKKNRSKAGKGKKKENGRPNKKEEEAQLGNLQEMFRDKLDPVVVHMILEDNEFNVDKALDTLFQLAEVPEDSMEAQRNRFKDIYPSQLSNSDSSGTDSPHITGSDHKYPSCDSNNGQNFNSSHSEDKPHLDYGYDMGQPDLLPNYFHQTLSTNTDREPRYLQSYGQNIYSYDYNQRPSTKLETSSMMGLDEIDDTEKYKKEEKFEIESKYNQSIYKNYAKDTQDFQKYRENADTCTTSHNVPHLGISVTSSEVTGLSGRSDYENPRSLHSSVKYEQNVGNPVFATGSNMNEYIAGQQVVIPRVFKPSMTPMFTVPKVSPMYPSSPYRYPFQPPVRQTSYLPQDTSVYSMNLQNSVSHTPAGFKTEYAMHRNLPGSNKSVDDNPPDTKSAFERHYGEDISSPFNTPSPFSKVPLHAKEMPQTSEMLFQRPHDVKYTGGGISYDLNSFGLYGYPTEHMKGFNHLPHEKASNQENFTEKPIVEPSWKEESGFNVYQDKSAGERTSNLPHSSFSSERIGHQGRQLPTDLLSQTNSFPENSNPSWPKKKSEITRREFPSSKHQETFVKPLPGGKVLCVMRGCPGSGKSTLARTLKGNGVIFSTDDFFMKNVIYNFDVTQIGEAHDWNKKRAFNAMKSGVTPIIIDNTNTQLWEFKPYIKMALKLHYQMEIREPDTPWKDNVKELTKRNSHGVSEEAIAKMLERFEKISSLESITDAYEPHHDRQQNRHADHRKHDQDHHHHQRGRGVEDGQSRACQSHRKNLNMPEQKMQLSKERRSKGGPAQKNDRTRGRSPATHKHVSKKVDDAKRKAGNELLQVPAGGGDLNQNDADADDDGWQKVDRKPKERSSQNAVDVEVGDWQEVGHKPRERSRSRQRRQNKGKDVKKAPAPDSSCHEIRQPVKEDFIIPGVRLDTFLGNQGLSTWEDDLNGGRLLLRGDLWGDAVSSDSVKEPETKMDAPDGSASSYLQEKCRSLQDRVNKVQDDVLRGIRDKADGVTRDAEVRSEMVTHHKEELDDASYKKGTHVGKDRELSKKTQDKFEGAEIGQEISTLGSDWKLSKNTKLIENQPEISPVLSVTESGVAPNFTHENTWRMAGMSDHQVEGFDWDQDLPAGNEFSEGEAPHVQRETFTWRGVHTPHTYQPKPEDCMERVTGTHDGKDGKALNTVSQYRFTTAAVPEDPYLSSPPASDEEGGEWSQEQEWVTSTKTSKESKSGTPHRPMEQSDTPRRRTSSDSKSKDLEVSVAVGRNDIVKEPSSSEVKEQLASQISQSVNSFVFSDSFADHKDPKKSATKPTAKLDSSSDLEFHFTPISESDDNTISSGAIPKRVRTQSVPPVSYQDITNTPATVPSTSSRGKRRAQTPLGWKKSPALAPVFLDAQTKHKAMLGDWSADFEKSIVSESGRDYNRGCTPPRLIQTLHRSCQTESADFAFLQRLEAGNLIEGDVKGVKIVAVLKEWKMISDTSLSPDGFAHATGFSDVSLKEGEIPRKMKYDKGCMTDDLQTEVTELKVILEQLKAFFPDEPESVLQHFLDVCQGDVEWATNLMLDTSRVPLPEKDKSLGSDKEFSSPSSSNTDSGSYPKSISCQTEEDDYRVLKRLNSGFYKQSDIPDYKVIEPSKKGWKCGRSLLLPKGLDKATGTNDLDIAKKPLKEHVKEEVGKKSVTVNRNPNATAQAEKEQTTTKKMLLQKSNEKLAKETDSAKDNLNTPKEKHTSTITENKKAEDNSKNGSKVKAIDDTMKQSKKEEKVHYRYPPGDVPHDMKIPLIRGPDCEPKWKKKIREQSRQRFEEVLKTCYGDIEEAKKILLDEENLTMGMEFKNYFGTDNEEMETQLAEVILEATKERERKYLENERKKKAASAGKKQEAGSKRRYGDYSRIDDYDDELNTARERQKSVEKEKLSPEDLERQKCLIAEIKTFDEFTLSGSIGSDVMNDSKNKTDSVHAIDGDIQEEEEDDSQNVPEEGSGGKKKKKSRKKKKGKSSASASVENVNEQSQPLISSQGQDEGEAGKQPQALSSSNLEQNALCTREEGAGEETREKSETAGLRRKVSRSHEREHRREEESQDGDGKKTEKGRGLNKEMNLRHVEQKNDNSDGTSSETKDYAFLKDEKKRKNKDEQTDPKLEKKKKASERVSFTSHENVSEFQMQVTEEQVYCAEKSRKQDVPLVESKNFESEQPWEIVGSKIRPATPEQRKLDKKTASTQRNKAQVLETEVTLGVSATSSVTLGEIGSTSVGGTTLRATSGLLGAEGSPHQGTGTIGGGEVDMGRAKEDYPDLDDLMEKGKGVPERFQHGLVFQLDPAFALQLQEIFGPVGFHLDTDNLSGEDFCIPLDLKFAKDIHSVWCKNFQEKYKKEEMQLKDMMQADEEFARKLQKEEDEEKLKEEEKKKFAQEKKTPWNREQKMGAVRPQIPVTIALTSSLNSQSRYQPSITPTPERFEDIMNEDAAKQLSKDLQQEAQISGADTLAANLKRQHLMEAFPGVDQIWMEETFMQNKYELEPTITQINNHLGMSGEAKNVFSVEALHRLEREMMGKALKESMGQQQDAKPKGVQRSASPLKNSRVRSASPQKYNQARSASPQKNSRARSASPQKYNQARSASPQKNSEELGKFQSMEHPGYHDYRAEANQHYQERQICLKKAAENYMKGMYEVAAHYSRQGQTHQVLLEEAHKRASEAILKERIDVIERENTLDLHGLHTTEAVDALTNIMREKIRRLGTPHGGPRYLDIITGRGLNSQGGIARIKRAVRIFLDNKGYRYSILNPGLIRVHF